jgi:H+-translocating NAD(P) transhydrogenase subunit beta
MTGFVLGNNVLIIAGALVGASRHHPDEDHVRRHEPLADERAVRRLRLGGGRQRAQRPDGPLGPRHHAEDAAILLSYARSVVFVPGYGLAVSQAQHQVRELADLICRPAGSR